MIFRHLLIVYFITWWSGCDFDHRRRYHYYHHHHYKFAGNKTSRGLCPTCYCKACMYCLARQNGHFQSQIVVPQLPSLFSVQPNGPSMLCDRFMGKFKTIALLVLSPANTSEYKKSNVKDTNIINRKNTAMIVIAPSSLFCMLTSNVLCIP